MELPSVLRHPLPAACLLALAAGACSDARPSPTEPVTVSAAAKPGKGKPGGDMPVVEDFEAWDPSLWSAGDHPLGRGWFRPENVSVSGGELTLRLPSGTWDGGEIRSAERHGRGSYEARIKAADAPGSLTAFFLYEYTERNIDEIDVEILGDGSGRVMFTTWQRSRQTNHAEVVLDFDPSEAFHLYRIEYGRKSVRFYVDDVLMATFTQGLPTASMYVMANAWWPTWLTGSQPTTDRGAAIDWIRY